MYSAMCVWKLITNGVANNCVGCIAATAAAAAAHLPLATYRIKLLQLYKNCKVFYHSAAMAAAEEKPKQKNFYFLFRTVCPSAPLPLPSAPLSVLDSMPARRAIKLFTNRTGTVHGKNLVTTEKDERNICVYKRITVSLSIYACAGRGRGVAKGERRRREGRVRGREQSSSVNVSGSGPATGHLTRLLTDINTRVPTHTHPSTHTYVMAGRPPAYSYALSECVSLCVCMFVGGRSFWFSYIQL